MSLVVPDVGEVAMLNSILSVTASAVLDPLILKLYSNNITPANSDTAGTYTTVVGGGYASVSLDKTNWVVTGGSPSVAQYNAFISFSFTGATNAPGTIYGYYIVDTNNTLICAERFPAPPFTPINGSLIRVKPRLTCASSVSD